MDPVKFRNKHGPEWRIQKELVDFLKARLWHVERMIGNAYQFGIPDLYIGHTRYGTRWIDVKNPVDYEFTKQQKKKWPVWERYGIGIWIITGATQEEYAKLFEPPNWRKYWKPKYDEEPTIDELLEELNEPTD